MEFQADSLIAFEWQRPIGAEPAYEWTNDRLSLECYGNERHPIRKETRWLCRRAQAQEASYRPLDDAPELFREFMDVEQGEAGYLRFAQRYGMLGAAVPLESDDDQMGESFRDWVLAHGRIRFVWQVYQAICRSRAGEVWALLEKYRSSRPGPPLLLPVVFYAERPSPSQRLRLAMDWVQRSINLRMEEGVAPVLEPIEGGRYALRFRPRTLAGAMWLQLAKSIEGQLEYRQCNYEKCSQWFLLSPVGAGKRKHAQFCSDRCRLRAWRADQLSARRKSKRARVKGAGR